MRQLLLALFALSLLVTGCSRASDSKAPSVPLPEVTVGVVGATQPLGTTDLLAGYIPDSREEASDKDLIEFDTRLMVLLREHSGPSRTFRFLPAGEVFLTGKNADTQSGSRASALQHWVNVGKAAGLELLIVPQILTWHQREGSAGGAVSSAEININFYLIDVTNGALLQRAHFAEKQQNLSSNLLNAGTFFKRGAKWLTAQELADEGVVKMIKEFGL